MRMLLFAVVATFFVTSCTDPNQEKIDALKAEAIAVHDEVMPRMGAIADLRSTLKKQWKDVSADTSSTGDTIAQFIAGRISMLDSADEAMMSWMADYDPTYENEHQSDSAVIYYSGQGEEIKEVKLLMEKAIEDAEELADYFK
ncbi:MAG: hypothetical protein HN728_10500 [Flavobacteriales bacterium]|jgi:hypothetical protein|nr:hypothetical protein [Flavobacteriales bacterium]MBT4705374.1 hypothetical protein [Flavobacteriales bacterium]MBT4929875.1 hypothetical protein [Flavobacteriales bacterium]MBT6133034.1 hypothetical protein [Flavobacteriales bacterium]MBT6382471.1 hypothetical protein [Flavobacteriales bacterium]